MSDHDRRPSVEVEGVEGVEGVEVNSEIETEAMTRGDANIEGVEVDASRSREGDTKVEVAAEVNDQRRARYRSVIRGQ